MNMQLSRRHLLQAAGGLVVSFSMTGKLAAIESLTGPVRATKVGSVDSWLSIAADGSVTAFTGKIDMGTGVRTAFAQIVAEELDVPLARVSLVMGDTARTPDQGKSTASQNIVTGVQPLKVAAAEARASLVKLAAERMGVPANTLTAVNGMVRPVSTSTGGIAYADLLKDKLFSIDLEVDKETPWGPLLKVKSPLKPVDKYTIVGKPIHREDVPPKVTGTLEYVHNVRVPGMLHGRTIRPPAIGAKLVSVDDGAVRSMKDVRVVRRADFLGVVAEREEDAIRAAGLVKATWTQSATLPEQRDLYRSLRAARVVEDQKGKPSGDVDAGLAKAKFRVKADYDFAFQLHAMIGPSCAVADVRKDEAVIWSGSQWPQGDRSDVAKMLGLPLEKVQVIWREASGSYGRLGCDDAAADAAIMSQVVGKPVRVQWMREEEHGLEPLSPAVSMSVECAADENGKLTAFDYTQYSASHATGEKGNHLAWRLIGTAPGYKRMSGGAANFYYNIANARSRNVFVEPWFRAIYLRAPGGQQSIFAYESIIDELAFAAGIDPLEFRLRNAADDRDRAVLEAARKISDWRPGSSGSRGSKDAVLTGRGVAMARYGAGESRVASVADVEVERASGKVRVKRIFLALDVGLIVNPDGLLNQAEGGLVQGISRSIHEQVMFDREKVTSVDWMGYPILRFSELPDVKVELISRPDQPSSAVGEVGNIATTAVIANALFDALGKRIRHVPFAPEVVKTLL
jgi:CO/xanthine dehydrogenase Mo-binding subunit